MPAEVVVYRTPICPYCIRARQLLDKKAVPYTEVDVSGAYEQRLWLFQITGRRTVPQIFVNGRPIGGCDELYTLERAGKLDALLAEERDHRGASPHPPAE